MTSDDVLSIEEAGMRLGIGVNSAYKLARAGQMPGAFRTLRLWRVSRPALEAFLADPHELVVKEPA